MTLALGAAAFFVGCSSDSTTPASTTNEVAQGAAVGGACASTADCDTGLTCATDDPGGQCVKGCGAQSDCPDGSTCTDESTCYATCSTNADCPRTGYACVDAMTIGGQPTKTCDTP
ncbi:MAG TPA: hypothetical protein VGM56_15245 [Byssovorax sp.]